MSRKPNTNTDDIFAAIGGLAEIHAKDGLEPMPAAPVPGRRLNGRAIHPAAARPVYRPMLDAAGLERELDRLEKHYAPYLRELAPPLPCARRRVPLDTWDWRRDDDLAGFAELDADGGAWETVRIPHFGGPLGRARNWYRKEIKVGRGWLKSGRPWLVLRGVDYRCKVYVNGACAGSHEGAFAPVQLDLSRWLRAGVNRILVEVENDFVSLGNASWGSALDGSKLYAATGPGFDDPHQGWRHCPPGMGMWQEAFLETRPDPHIASAFVRCLDHAKGEAELRVQIFRSAPLKEKVRLSAVVHGLNHSVPPVTFELAPEPPAGLDFTDYTLRFTVSDPKAWTPETPWLYRCDIELNGDNARDVQSCEFGLRTFVLDRTRKPLFRPLLNGREIRLRGANTMGFEQLRVMKGDRPGLIRDLLTAKACNMNFLRLTQRPVQTEVYAACDRLGILIQTDFPLFAQMPRFQWPEAVRQCGEMERLVRPHPCVVMVTFINEPFPPSWSPDAHLRHCTRPELEAFFSAASMWIRILNPDRQIKPIDGDYNPPGPGMPDYHCYSTWYLNHGTAVGRIIRGEWLPAPPDTMIGCGEFGGEGLDRPELMMRHFPKEWLPQSPEEDERWTPNQTRVPGWASLPEAGDFHYLWFETPKTMRGWSEAAQAHHEWAVRIMAEAIRRQDRIASCAVHLLIDAFPSSMMFSLVDFERVPKPAFFSLREIYAPLALSWRSDRTTYFSGEPLAEELWLSDDTGNPPRDAEVRWRLIIGGKVAAAQSLKAAPKPLRSVPVGLLASRLPEVEKPTAARLEAELVVDGKGRQCCFREFQVRPAAAPLPAKVRIATTGPHGRALAESLGLTLIPLRSAGSGDCIVVEGAPSGRMKGFEKALKRGARLVILDLPEGRHTICGHEVSVIHASFGDRIMVSRDTGHPWVTDLEPNDIRLWHDEATGMIQPICTTAIEHGDGWTPVLRVGVGGWGTSWRVENCCIERPTDSGGRIVLCQVALAGRVRTNPAARALAAALLAAQ